MSNFPPLSLSFLLLFLLLTSLIKLFTSALLCKRTAYVFTPPPPMTGMQAGPIADDYPTHLSAGIGYDIIRIVLTSIFLAKVTQIFCDFLGYFGIHPFKVKTAVVSFWSTFRKFWGIFNPTSGHIAVVFDKMQSEVVRSNPFPTFFVIKRC